MPESRISLVVMGANGRIGRLLQAHWRVHPPPGLRVRWQSRAPVDSNGPLVADWPLAADRICWSLNRGADALAAEWAGTADVVLVLAGVTPGPGAEYADNTALATAAMLAARKAGVRHVILASSSAVYGIPAGTDPVSEAALPAPANPYGQAKWAMEQAVLAMEGPGLTILRIGNVAGTDQLFRAMGLATAAAPLMLDRFANGQTPQRSYIGPATFARVIERLAHAAAKGTLPVLLNLAAPGGVSMADLLLAMALAGLPVPHRFRPAPAQALPRLLLDTALLQTLAPIPLPEADADAMVAQWLALRTGAP